MKEAYGYRSKAVHGATFKGATFDRLREVATRVDGICRDISALYLDTNSGVAALIEGHNDHLNSRFARMILGQS